MTNPIQMDPQADAAMNQQYMAELQNTFEKLPNDIELMLFTERGRDDVFCDAARQVIRVFRQLSSKISLKEFDLDHELAIKHGVTQSPTLLIAPDRYNIRWIGAPMGEEGRSFLETLIFVGLGNTNLTDQSKKVLERIDSPRQLKVFTSPTCPYCPQQVVNGVRAAIGNPQHVSVEIIDIQCKPDIADQYSAHSVPQAFANEILIGMGAQAEEVFMLSLLKMEPQTIFIPESDAELVETDVVVVGGGPAGLTAAIYLERSGLKTAVIERDALGGQVATTPTVENYPGFTQVGGKTLVDIMVSHALEYVQIFQGEEVHAIESAHPPFTVSTSRRKFKTKTILLATGASHKKLGVPGEQRLSGRGVSYCATCDGPLFKNRKAVVIGGGNSAITEALYLYQAGVDVSLIHRRDKLRAQEFLTKQLADANIPVHWNSEVKEVVGNERVESVTLYNNQTDETTTLPTDGVFLSIGYTPTVELAHKAGVELTEEGYVKTDRKHRASIPGIYSAGDVEGGFKQIVTAAGYGAEAAMTIFEDLINPYWQEKKAAEK
jgi:thioredoxin reductase (NADPH)